MFPSWEAVWRRYREVVIFTVGLMKDPRPLVDHIYEMMVEFNLNKMRTEGGLGRPSIDADLFKSLYTEATALLPDDPLHNNNINYYDYDDDAMKERPFDTTPIYYPSALYYFENISEDFKLDKRTEHGAEIPECAMYISRPDDTITMSLLSKCRIISQHQPVRDFKMFGVRGLDLTEAEAPVMSRETRSVNLTHCTLPPSFIRSILRQLFCSSDSLSLMDLSFNEMDLRDGEDELDKLLEHLISHHESGLAQRKLWLKVWLSEKFIKKWRKRCEGITSIEYEMSVCESDSDGDEVESDSDQSESGPLELQSDPRSLSTNLSDYDARFAMLDKAITDCLS